jgi:hypothetical protein
MSIAFSAFGFCPRQTPTEVDINQMQAAGFAPLAKPREDDSDEIVSFRVHVAECRRDEDPDGFPFACH